MKISHRPGFWIFQVILFIVGLFLAIQYYPKAFPVIDFPIEMNRISAVQEATSLAKKFHWERQNERQTASFDVDSHVQNFIELTAGGGKGFRKVLESGLYYPYLWRVRLFLEGKTEETQILFTPQGKRYGFYRKIPEDEKGPALNEEKALQIAEKEAQENWEVIFSPFRLIEKSKEIRPSGRVDHTFVYERPNESIGEGKYRLRLVVSGDHLSELTHFVKIPEDFLRRYEEMRSGNNTIAIIANVAIFLLYLLLGCGVGIIFIAKKQGLLWKTPVKMALGVALLQFLEQINQIPTLWMEYDTAISENSYLVKNLLSSLVGFLGDWVLLAISFMAAESLTRRAFPNHPQLWKIWRTRLASSWEVLGRTVGGYLSIGVFLAFVVLLYLLGTQVLGWWTPSQALFQPDALETYFPWFTSIARSLHAGFWEESLFRAVPIAGAVLIGRTLGRPKLWLGIGFIVQALVFAAAHANYPAQPSYARVIELIVPSLFFGGLYTFFGLLPGIILHFTYDVVMFSISLFAIQAKGIWVDRLLIIFFTLTPLWVVLIARLRAGRWRHLDKNDLNESWVPQEAEKPIIRKAVVVQGIRVPLWIPKAIKIVSPLVFLLWAFLYPFHNDALRLEINRNEAVLIAKKSLEEKGVALGQEWEPLPMLSGSLEEDDRFIWRTEGKDRYRSLMGSYLLPPLWRVRFVRFNADPISRAEEYQVFLGGKKEVFRIRHELPENQAGETLSQEEAREIALKGVQSRYPLIAKAVQEIKSVAAKLPSRKDWVFTFRDPSVPLAQGEARIGVHVAGNQVASMRKYIHIPEEWLRKDRLRENAIGIVRGVSVIFIGLLIFVGFVLSIRSRIKSKDSFKPILTLIGIVGGLEVSQAFNNYPIFRGSFSTAQPVSNQWITYVSIYGIQTLFFSVCAALLFDFIHHVFLEQRREAAPPRVFGVGTTCGCAVLMFISLAGLMLVLPSQEPIWGRVSGLDARVPLLAVLRICQVFGGVTLLVQLVSYFFHELFHRSSKFARGVGILFLAVFSFALSGATADDLYSWIILGIVYSVFSYILFRIILYFRMDLVPLFVGTMVALFLYWDIQLDPYVGSAFASTLKWALLFVMAVGWYLYFSKPLQKSSPVSP